MRNKTHRLPPFVPILWGMLNSEAYKVLSPMSAKVLPFFLGKVKTSVRDLAYYTTTFSFTYSEATRYGCSRRTFPRVIDDLMRHGFIDPVEKGGLRGCGLTSNTFKLSSRWKRYGAPDFTEVAWRSFNKDEACRQGQKCPRTGAKMALDAVQK